MTSTFNPPAPLHTAVLFLVFNRPDTTTQVFEAIRQAKPPRLYVASDGPRVGQEGEAERVAEVRVIATAVDWPCEVKTLFREENLGCRYAPSGAIDWFFEHEEQGIILEDDCLPHPDFFRYCQACLNKFKTDHRIWHINGNNFGADKSLYRDDDISFISLAQVWGWASWADRWKYSEKNTFYLSEHAQKSMAKWNISEIAKINKKHHLESLKRGLDAWDYQWQITVLNHSGYAISPSSNLITNVGDGPDATHTKSDTSRIRLRVRNLSGFKYSEVALNKELTGWYEKKMGLKSIRNPVRLFIVNIYNKFKLRLKNLVQKILFFKCAPIIVASTGRAGSTLLANAIAGSLINSRFWYFPGRARKALSRFAVEYLNRLSGIDDSCAPILKTHDLYSQEFRGKGRYVFIFGDPFESALSVSNMGALHGDVWIEEHIYHLCGHGSVDEIFECDVLNYETQVRSWQKAKCAYIVHYDELWRQRDSLSEFLGIDLRLPARRPRVAKCPVSIYNKQLFERLKQVEAGLKAYSQSRFAKTI